MKINAIRVSYTWARISAFSLLCAGPAYAQAVSPQFDPSRIQEQIPAEIMKQKPSGLSEIPLITGVPEKSEIVEDGSGVSFPVRHLVVNNGTVFSDEQIQAQIKGAIGSNVTLTDLRRAAANITNLYRKNGYPFSQAFIPRQTLENDTVYIEIIEGYVAEVDFKGVPKTGHAALGRYADELKAKRPLSQADLERYTLLMNDLYGIQSKAVLSLIGNDPGAVRVTYLVNETQHEVGGTISNRGSYAMGPLQAASYYSLNNLLGQNEQSSLLYLKTPVSNELSYLAFTQSWPIGPYGTKLVYSLRKTDSKPGKSAQAFEINGESKSAEVSLLHPWVRSREQNFSTTLSFDVRDSMTTSFDLPLIEDRLRYVRLGMDYDRLDFGGITSLNVTVSKGLGIMNYTEEDDLMASRLGASAESSKINAYIKRYQTLSERVALSLQASGQWSFSPLLSPELFGLGGQDFGRAFDFSTLTGDKGYGGSAELSYTLPSFMREINNLSFYTFIDGGRVYDEAEALNENWKGLYSTGVGVDLVTYSIFNARVELATPLKIDADLDNEGTRAYGSVGMHLKF